MSMLSRQVHYVVNFFVAGYQICSLADPPHNRNLQHTKFCGVTAFVCVSRTNLHVPYGIIRAFFFHRSCHRHVRQTHLHSNLLQSIASHMTINTDLRLFNCCDKHRIYNPPLNDPYAITLHANCTQIPKIHSGDGFEMHFVSVSWWMPRELIVHATPNV